MSTQQPPTVTDCLKRYNNYISKIKKFQAIKREMKPGKKDRNAVLIDTLDKGISLYLKLTKQIYTTNRPCSGLFIEYCKNLENRKTNLCWNRFRTFAYSHYAKNPATADLWRRLTPEQHRKIISTKYQSYKEKLRTASSQ